MDLQRGSEPTLGKTRYEALEHEIAQYDTPNAKHSNMYRVLDAVSMAARRHAEANNVDDWDFQADLLRPGFDMVDAILWGTHKQDAPAEEKVKLWCHRQDLFDLIRANKALWLNKAYLEHATGLYLALPYREPTVDRMLSDALIALEASAFADEMLNEQTFPQLGPPSSPLKQKHPFGIYMKAQMWNVVGVAAVVGGSTALYVYGYVGGATAFWVSAGWTALTVLSVILATATLPTRWKRHNKAKETVATLMREMLQCYNELQSSGPISARRLLERLRRADEKGVSWPASLYALLDDVMARSGRL